jgi:hypothetical protein
MRGLTDAHYPDAGQISVVLDNLSTHPAGAWYERFPGTRSAPHSPRLEFHRTPEHASWLKHDRDRGSACHVGSVWIGALLIGLPSTPKFAGRPARMKPMALDTRSPSGMQTQARPSRSLSYIVIGGCAV